MQVGLQQLLDTVLLTERSLSSLVRSTFGISDLLLLLLRDGWVHHRPFSLPLGLIPICRLFWVVFCLL
ncbi:unnamed protein product [Sphagnum troendelagicum]|uniref:Uncharacterized protein n=1 Tax=Sphagnum troendelagicum TaxID=128251 RepID=A0ABP0UUS3_9BRYO